MYNWEDEEFYDESQYASEIECLRDAIRGSVKKEILDEMKRLETENKKLQGIKEHFEEIERDYERKKEECDRIIAAAEYRARSARLEEILRDHKLIKWKVACTLAYGPKCEKCDKSRQIKVMLPSGRTVDDRCQCKTGDGRYYYPVPYGLHEISDKTYGIRAFYKECSAYDGEKYYVVDREFSMSILDDSMKKNIEDWKNHKMKEDKITSFLFDDREECQNICDVLNEKQGHPEWIYNLEGESLVEVK